MDPDRVVQLLIEQDIARLTAGKVALHDVTRDALLTCPACGVSQRATMPLDACQVIFDCQQCGTRLRPLEGDCCVFCSYADTVCPPKQQEDACC